MSGDWISQNKIDVFTTCRDCGTLMKVIDSDQHSHPTCIQYPTELESLGLRWLEETNNGNHEWARDTAKLIESVSILELGRAAIEYTDWQWPVFPLATGKKTPAIKKDPKTGRGNGFKDATTDSGRIDKWWSRHPDHNIGLATGHMFDVIDVDTKDSDGNPDPKGVLSFLSLLQSGDLPECHGVAITASGGTHLYVKATGKGNFAGIRPGVDYRGLGGYVVAPPSTLRQPGRDYTWLVEPSPIIKGEF